jgi:hypothetical protein
VSFTDFGKARVGEMGVGVFGEGKVETIIKIKRENKLF